MLIIARAFFNVCNCALTGHPVGIFACPIGQFLALLNYRTVIGREFLHSKFGNLLVILFAK